MSSRIRRAAGATSGAATWLPLSFGAAGSGLAPCADGGSVRAGTTTLLRFAPAAL
jgi:hypothetical protein